MIVYFINRSTEILGVASTNLDQGYRIIDDTISEDIDSGVSSLDLTVAWNDDTRLQLEDWMQAGNYALLEHNNEAKMYTIITSETDTADKSVTIYCEDAGLDLINENAPAFTATSAHGIEWYINQFLGDSDFEIGTNEIEDLTRTLSWDGTSTVTERIRSIATQFDNAEISYSFEVDNLVITHKYINIWEKRGTDIDQELRLDRDINSFRVITSVESLYTGLTVKGGTPEGKSAPIDLVGYSYDDGDNYVDANGNLLSRDGAERWGRMTKGDDLSFIMGSFEFDTTSKSELCNRAVAYLNQHKEPAVNYEVDIERGLEDSRIGDRVNLVDDKGGIYISARILALKTSVTQNRKEATLGEFLIKSSGISDRVMELASQFEQLASERSLNYSLSISSSAGSYFINHKVNTTLTASVIHAGTTETEWESAQVNWYSGGSLIGTGLTYTVTNQDSISITARLESDGEILAEDYITLFSVNMVYQTAEDALETAENGITTDTLHYLATPLGSGVTTQTAGWTTAPQSMTATNKYLWTYHTYTKASGTTVDTAPVITGTYGEKGDTGAKGDTGDTGVGVSSVQPQYYLSTSPSSLSGGSWSETLVYTSGKYIWTRDKVTYTDNSVNYSNAIYNSALTTACENSASALQIAQDTDQHFWFTETGTDTGAHITEISQDDFLSDPQSGGANLLARSNGIAVRDGLAELAVFGANGAQIGKGDEMRFVIMPNKVSGITGEGGSYFNLEASTGTAQTNVTINSGGGTAGNTVTISEVNLSDSNTTYYIDFLRIITASSPLDSRLRWAQYSHVGGASWSYTTPTSAEGYTFTLVYDYNAKTLTCSTDDPRTTHVQVTDISYYDTISGSVFSVGTVAEHGETSPFVATLGENLIPPSTTGGVAIGTNNVGNETDTLFVVGHGTSTLRANVFAIDTVGQIYPQNTLMDDFVTAQGDSNGWHYRKWKRGKIEAWYTGEVTASTTSTAGNVYRSSYSLSIPSGIFGSAPHSIISFEQSATTVFAINGTASSKTAISGYIFRTGSSTSTYNVSLSVYAWLN